MMNCEIIDNLLDDENVINIKMRSPQEIRYRTKNGEVLFATRTFSGKEEYLNFVEHLISQYTRMEHLDDLPFGGYKFFVEKPGNYNLQICVDPHFMEGTDSYEAGCPFVHIRKLSVNTKKKGK